MTEDGEMGGGTKRVAKKSSPAFEARSRSETCGRPKLSLALQGGGAHGAFTWGVLDRLLQEDRYVIDAIVGTSAGAMNGAVVTCGLEADGAEGGRKLLRKFWDKVARLAMTSPNQPTPFDRLLSPGDMDFSPGWIMFNALTQAVSPYYLNPTNYHPLRGALNETINFDQVCHARRVKLFLCATNVKRGKIKIFMGDEISVDAILASAALPQFFQAIEIKGEYYWDGGYMGNPPIYPLIYRADALDIMIVEINPIEIPELPTTAQDIADRVNTLSFNSSLMREMRTIHLVTQMLDAGRLDNERYKRLRFHGIEAESEMAKLGVSSKLNANRDFLRYLFDLGRDRCEKWLHEHGDKVGEDSSLDIKERYL